jgi:hypothetical protein
MRKQPCPDCVRDVDDLGRLFADVLSGRSLNTSLHELAAKLAGNGMNSADAAEFLRALFSHAPRYECWQFHYDDIPHITARAGASSMVKPLNAE